MDVSVDGATRMDQVRFQPRLGRLTTDGTVFSPNGSATAGNKLVPAAGTLADLNAGTHDGSPFRTTCSNAKGAGDPAARGSSQSARKPIEAD